MLPSNCVAVTVVGAKNLTSHSQSGKNDVFATVQLNSEKYQTSVQQKTSLPVWQERFELEMRSKYSLLIVSLYRRTFLGFNEFLGQLRLPMDEFCDLEPDMRPRPRWYPLKGKSGASDEHKYRGELQVMLEFFNRSPSTEAVRKTTTSTNNSFFGSGNPLGNVNVDLRRSVLHNLGKSLRLRTMGKKLIDNKKTQLPTAGSLPALSFLAQRNAEERAGDNVLMKSFFGRPRKRFVTADVSRFDAKDRTSDDGENNGTQNLDTEPVPAEPFDSKLKSFSNHDSKAGTEKEWHSNLLREELIEIVEEQKTVLNRQHRRIRELEEYIDQLVFKVMNCHPELLQITDVNVRSCHR